jgi:membrane fusion protein, heavy metal efflux system
VVQSLQKLKLKPKLLYAATIAWLLGLGYIGHATHWAFRKADKAEQANKAVGNETGRQHLCSVRNSNGLQNIVFENSQNITDSGIELDRVQIQTIKREIVASASVEYDRRRSVELSSRAAGVIFAVNRLSGHSVQAGDVIAIVEAGDVGRLKSDFAQAILNWKLKHRTLLRFQMAGESVPMKVIHEAQSAIQLAKVELLSAQQALINLGFKVAVDDYIHLDEVEIVTALRYLGLDEPDLQYLLDRTQSSNLLPIRSPITGIVISNDSAIGESVSPEKPFMEISDLSKVWVSLDIRKENATTVRIGQPVTFKPDGMKGQVTGNINWISTGVDEKTRTLHVRAEINNPQVADNDLVSQDCYLLRANMFGTGVIQVEEQTVLTVHQSCLHQDNGQIIVFVQTQANTFEPRVVTSDIVDGDRVAIVGDLRQGDLIAARGSQMLKSELVLGKLSGNVD